MAVDLSRALEMLEEVKAKRPPRRFKLIIPESGEPTPIEATLDSLGGDKSAAGGFQLDSTMPGGGEPGPTSPSGFASAPSITNDSPTTLGGMLASAVTGNPAPSSMTTKGINTAITLAGKLAGIPTAPITVPVALLGQLSQFAHRLGLVGQDTSGMMGLTQGEIDAAMGIAPGSGPNVSAALAQGLGISPGQLAALNLNATFNLDPSFSPVGSSGDPDGGGNPGAGGEGSPGSGVSGGSGAGPGPGVAGDIDRGGLVRKKRAATRPIPGDREHVMAKVHRDEFVVRPSETKKLLPALKDLNRPGVSPLERRVRAFEKKHGAHAI